MNLFGLELTSGIAISYGIFIVACCFVFFGQLKINRIPVWSLLLVISILSALSTDILTIVGTVFIALFALFSFTLTAPQTPKWMKIFSAVMVTVLTFAFSFHAIPGFTSALVIPEQIISNGALPVKKWATFDKPVVGLLLVGLVFNRLSITQTKLNETLNVLAVFIVLSIASFSLAIFFGLIVWEPKISMLFIGWAVTNLFLTCITEEAFFRGFFQQYLSSWLATKNIHSMFGVIASGSFFGLVHLGGGVKYMLVASLIGIGYAYVYDKTRSLLAAVLAHFSFNSAHFLLFTYPLLA